MSLAKRRPAANIKKRIRTILGIALYWCARTLAQKDLTSQDISRAPPGEDASKIAKQFKELSMHAYVDFYWSAVIYAALGDNDEAFRLLKKPYLERSAALPYLAVDPFWYRMRSDLRYADLLRRIGLPQ